MENLPGLAGRIIEAMRAAGRPVTTKDLHAALGAHSTRITVELQRMRISGAVEAGKGFTYSLGHARDFGGKLLATVKNRSVVISAAEVACMFCRNKMVSLTMLDGRNYVTDLTAERIMQENPGQFLRLSRRHAVRPEVVEAIDTRYSMAAVLVFGNWLPVARARIREVSKALPNIPRHNH